MVLQRKVHPLERSRTSTPFLQEGPDIFNPCSGAHHRCGSDLNGPEHVSVVAVDAQGRPVKSKDSGGVERSRIHVHTDVAQWTKDHEALQKYLRTLQTMNALAQMRIRAEAAEAAVPVSFTRRQ